MRGGPLPIDQPKRRFVRSDPSFTRWQEAECPAYMSYRSSFLFLPDAQVDRRPWRMTTETNAPKRSARLTYPGPESGCAAGAPRGAAEHGMSVGRENKDARSLERFAISTQLSRERPPGGQYWASSPAALLIAAAVQTGRSTRRSCSRWARRKLAVITIHAHAHIARIV